MSNEEIINFYKEQIKFYNDEVDWYTDQIKWYGKVIKEETYDFGLSLEGEKMKKARNKCYRIRRECKCKIKYYETKITMIA